MHYGFRAQLSLADFGKSLSARWACQQSRWESEDIPPPSRVPSSCSVCESVLSNRILTLLVKMSVMESGEDLQDFKGLFESWIWFQGWGSNWALVHVRVRVLAGMEKVKVGVLYLGWLVLLLCAGFYTCVFLFKKKLFYSIFMVLICRVWGHWFTCVSRLHLPWSCHGVENIFLVPAKNAREQPWQ